MGNAREYREDYLKSPSWMAIRDGILESKPDCQRCGKEPAREIHHLIYRNELALAKITDLFPVCRQCHNRIHRAIRLRLIPNPSRIGASKVCFAREKSKSVTDAEITAQQSAMQTKSFICDSLISRIRSASPNTQKRCLGILKCPSSHIDRIKFSGYRIQRVKGMLRFVDQHDGERLMAKSDKRRERLYANRPRKWRNG